jgi:hypothetical protein
MNKFSANDKPRLPLAVGLLALTACIGWLAPSLAQSAIGGPAKKQNYVGGPTASTNPVVAPHKGGTTAPTPVQPAIRTSKK